MKIIAVKFKEKFKKEFTGKSYFYKTNLKVNEGDFVVVDTIYGPEIAQVCNDEEVKNYIVDNDSIKFVICKVTFTEYNKMIKKLEQLTEMSEKINKLVAKLDRQRRKDEFLANYPEAKELVNEHEKLYNELGLNEE